MADQHINKLVGTAKHLTKIALQTNMKKVSWFFIRNKDLSVIRAVGVCEVRVHIRIDISACSGRRSLRSATKGDFLVPHARTATRQKRAFSIVGPSVWNDLPSELRSLPHDLSSSFYKLLKTLLFGRAWAGSASE